jgi:hypothetical protein
MRGLLASLLQEVVIRSWWVWAFALVCYGASEVVSARQEKVATALRHQLVMQSALVASEQDYQAELRTQLASRNDPAWIELTLMRCLGVVPEGQTKVYFYPGKDT